MSLLSPQTYEDLGIRELGQSGTSVSHSDSVHPKLVSVYEVANHLKVHYRTVQRWTRLNLIPHYRVGRSIRYSSEAVLEAIASSSPAGLRDQC